MFFMRNVLENGLRGQKRCNSGHGNVTENRTSLARSGEYILEGQREQVKMTGSYNRCSCKWWQIGDCDMFPLIKQTRTFTSSLLFEQQRFLLGSHIRINTKNYWK